MFLSSSKYLHERFDVIIVIIPRITQTTILIKPTWTISVRLLSAANNVKAAINDNERKAISIGNNNTDSVNPTLDIELSTDSLSSHCRRSNVPGRTMLMYGMTKAIMGCIA